MGCLNWARSCANMAPRPGVSPGMCPELQAPRLHSLRCSRQSRLQVQAGGVEETWPGQWRVLKQSPSFKTTTERILPTLQSFWCRQLLLLCSEGSGESMSSLKSPGIQSDCKEKGAELKLFGQTRETEM